MTLGGKQSQRTVSETEIVLRLRVEIKFSINSVVGDS